MTKQARKGALVRAGGLRRAGQIRQPPAQAAGRRWAGTPGKQPPQPSLKRGRSATPCHNARAACEQLDGCQGDAAVKSVEASPVEHDVGGGNGRGRGNVAEAWPAVHAAVAVRAAGFAEQQQPGRQGGLRSGRVRDPYRWSIRHICKDLHLSALTMSSCSSCSIESMPFRVAHSCETELDKGMTLSVLGNGSLLLRCGSFPESQDVRLENPARGRAGLGPQVHFAHISRRSHIQARPPVKGELCSAEIALVSPN